MYHVLKVIKKKKIILLIYYYLHHYLLIHSIVIQGILYHNDKPGTGDRPVYEGPEPKKFF